MGCALSTLDFTKLSCSLMTSNYFISVHSVSITDKLCLRHGSRSICSYYAIAKLARNNLEKHSIKKISACGSILVFVSMFFFVCLFVLFFFFVFFAKDLPNINNILESLSAFCYNFHVQMQLPPVTNSRQNQVEFEFEMVSEL